ncbi:MAG: ABC transporter permease subunit [Clostridia bacterium]|nr:ABC transporter permease subunit [Clostridia bacterium]
MKNKLKALFLSLISIVFWVSAWQICAMLMDRPYFLPSVSDTLSALSRLITSPEFYRVALYTVFRVIFGLLIGVFLGVGLAILSHHVKFVRILLSPIISVIKATPVASFIVVFWILLSGDAIAIVVAVLMVMPIIWQNVLDAYSSIDKDTEEMCRAYEFSRLKKFRLLTLPTLLKFFIPALITSVGLAWKSEIAAEIIAYTKNSIGQYINDAKYNLLTAEVFAWTLVVIIFSIAFERLARLALAALTKKRRGYAFYGTDTEKRK